MSEPQAAARGPHPGGAGPMRILVAIDGSRGSKAALRFAARLAARDARTELIVLTVGNRSPDAASAGGAGAGGRGRIDRRTVDPARKILEKAERELRASGVVPELRYVAAAPRSPVPDVISREADRVRADLVVVGSEGRDTLREWVVGGVALRLIYVARRPVAVIRPSRGR